jgi:hypothetical protein
MRRGELFFQPAGFFTEMPRFDEKQRNLLATLKNCSRTKKVKMGMKQD